MKKMDDAYLDYEHAAQNCKSHGGMFELNGQADKDAVMALPGWRMINANTNENGMRAVWVGKSGSISHAILDVNGNITAASPSFKTQAVCKKLPVQSHIDVILQEFQGNWSLSL